MKLDRKYTDNEKRNFVQTFIASGDSMNRWCKIMSLPHSTFYGWVKKYKSDLKPSE
ncbi:MAG: IS66 family insertion sequence element accessory protein TnpA, partial [Anaerocolumna sp.]